MSAPTSKNASHLRRESSYGPTPATSAGGADRSAPAERTRGEVQPWQDPDEAGDRPTAGQDRADQSGDGRQPGTTARLARLPEVLTAREAAALLRVGRNQLYEAVARGEIPALRIGRTIRIPTTTLLELLATRPRHPATTAQTDRLAAREER